MSSSPVGLDVREYVYAYISFTPLVAGFHKISARKNWLVTRVQFFAAAQASQIALDPSPAIPVAANGCLTFEPNGAFKDTVEVLGIGSVVVIEYWFQSQSDQFAQGIPINIEVPP